MEKQKGCRWAYPETIKPEAQATGFIVDAKDKVNRILILFKISPEMGIL